MRLHCISNHVALFVPYTEYPQDSRTNSASKTCTKLLTDSICFDKNLYKHDNNANE